jgi:hypothetical protein
MCQKVDQRRHIRRRYCRNIAWDCVYFQVDVRGRGYVPSDRKLHVPIGIFKEATP